MNTLQEFPFHRLISSLSNNVSCLFGFCRYAICVNLLKSSRQAGSCATIFFVKLQIIFFKFKEQILYIQNNWNLKRPNFWFNILPRSTVGLIVRMRRCTTLSIV